MHTQMVEKITQPEKCSNVHNFRVSNFSVFDKKKDEQINKFVWGFLLVLFYEQFSDLFVKSICVVHCFYRNSVIIAFKISSMSHRNKSLKVGRIATIMT